MRYGAGIQHPGFPNFSLRNLGFIAVRGGGNNGQINCCPGRTGHPAFNTLGRILERHQPRMVALKWYDGVWHDEIHRGWENALKRLMALMLTKSADSASPFFSETIGISDAQALPSLSDLFGFWKDRSGQISIAQHEQELNQIGSAKFCVINRKTGSPHLIVEHYGRGMNLYQRPGWRERLTGGRLDEQPDLAFGRWISDSFRDAIIVNEPSAVKVDVTTYDPAAKQRVRKIYTRLALPIEGGALLSGTVIHSSEILNSELGHEPK